MTNFNLCAFLLSLLGTTSMAVTGDVQEATLPHLRRASLKGNFAKSQSPFLAVFCDIADDELGFINTETDELIQVPYCDIEGWPFCSGQSAYTQHTAIDASGKTIFVSSVSNGDDVPASVMIMTYDDIDWDGENVSGLRVLKVVQYADADELSIFDYDIDGTGAQPIPAWTSPTYSQVHGPTFRPGSSNTIYWGTWTSDDIIAINTKSGGITTQQYDEARYAHGFFFNPSGDKAIGANYWFDAAFVSLFLFSKKSSMPSQVEKVYLDNADGSYGAYSHYATWLDDRYAYVATMQQGSTSLSGDFPVSGPGIYLIDADTGEATRVAGTSQNSKKEGVWNSGSDAIIANGKLFISEEETLDSDGNAGGVGSVGIWRIEDDRSLTWIKRLSPDKNGESQDGMPQGFGASHGSVVAKVGSKEYILVGSYTSNHIIKIDTDTDTVVKYWDATDGLSAPHGQFVAGAFR